MSGSLDPTHSSHPELDLSQSRQFNVVVCGVVTWVIAAVFVGARFYLRGYLSRILGSEDWMILVSLVLSLALSTSYILETVYGLGKHYVAIPVGDQQPLREAAWFTALWFALASWSSRISILLLFMRTLTYKWTTIVLWTFMVLVIFTGLLGVSVILTSCIPLNAYWDYSVHASHCHSPLIHYVIKGLQISTDFLIFLLPLPVILSVRAPRDQKAILTAVFSVGFIICIVSVVRLVEFVSLMTHDDYTYETVSLAFCSLVEVNTAIVCACIMTLKPLVSHILASVRNDARAPQHRLGSRNMHPPTIGSRPWGHVSKTASGRMLKSSWLTAQLARLDRSMPTYGGETDLIGDDIDLRHVDARTTSSNDLPSQPSAAKRHSPDRTIVIGPVTDFKERAQG